MTRELTPKERAWIDNLKKCLKQCPKSITLYISNEDSVFQVYDPKTTEVISCPDIKHGFEQGDPINDTFNPKRELQNLMVHA